jgi:predicted MFS family arabinose efflux permease
MARAALVRDRLTWLVYLQLGCYGYFLYGFGPSITLLRLEQDVSRGVSGLHGTAVAAGAALTGVAFAELTARFGRGAAMWLGVTGTCAGVLLLTASTAVPVTLAGAFAAGVFGSIVVNGSGVILAAHHGAGGPAAISEANAAASGIGLLAPLVIGFAVEQGFGWRPGLALIVPLSAVVAISFWRVRTPDHRAGATGPATGPATGRAEVGPGRRLPGLYWLAWLVLMLCIAVEFCMTIWSSDVTAARTGVSSGTAAAAVTAIGTGMFAGRLAGGRLALRFDTAYLLLAALTLTGVGFLVFWLSTAAWLAFAGLLISGLGISVHFPLGITRAIALSGGRPDLAAGRVSWAAGLAIGFGPFGLGALADAVGPHRAFLLVPTLLVLAAGGVALTMRGATRRGSIAAAATSHRSS